eukprot:COSAG01_NODE_26001_length_726_cov_1.385965_2_plen_50_part_01
MAVAATKSAAAAVFTARCPLLQEQINGLGLVYIISGINGLGLVYIISGLV